MVSRDQLCETSVTSPGVLETSVLSTESIDTSPANNALIVAITLRMIPLKGNQVYKYFLRHNFVV
jgi:hypothetical protein